IIKFVRATALPPVSRALTLFLFSFSWDLRPRLYAAVRFADSDHSNMRPDRLLRAILIWTAVTLIIVWLPFVRGLMDGDAYEWGNEFFGKRFGGHGVRGDYWLLVIEAAFGIFLLYLGWRGARPPFHWLLLFWQILIA